MTFVFTALLFSLMAQSRPQPPSSPSASAAQPQRVVVIGCLQSATVDGRNQFTLTTRDTDRPAADVKTLTYQLTPAASVDLKSQVGHRVEVTGTEPLAGTEQTQTDTTRTIEQPRGTSGKTPVVSTRSRADIVVRRLNVTSVKSVARDCRVR